MTNGLKCNHHCYNFHTFLNDFYTNTRLHTYLLKGYIKGLSTILWSAVFGSLWAHCDHETARWSGIMRPIKHLDTTQEQLLVHAPIMPGGFLVTIGPRPSKIETTHSLGNWFKSFISHFTFIVVIGFNLYGFAENVVVPREERVSSILSFPLDEAMPKRSMLYPGGRGEIRRLHRGKGNYFPLSVCKPLAP